MANEGTQKVTSPQKLKKGEYYIVKDVPPPMEASDEPKVGKKKSMMNHKASKRDVSPSFMF